MSLRLCQECYCWVEPEEARCPECLENFDSHSTEPTSEELEYLIGEILLNLGEVHLKRKLLPELGHLYATTNGFFFLPHEVHKVTAYAQSSKSSKVFWTIATLLWSPLMLFSVMFRSQNAKPTRVQQLVPRYLSRGETHELARNLLENRGTFFIKRQSIRQVHSRGKRWHIDRTEGSVLKLRPTSGSRDFQNQLEELVLLDPWQSLMIL